MKKPFVLLLLFIFIPSALGFISSALPKNVISFDYYISEPKDSAIFVVALYDNTDIYLDTTLGGTQTYLASLNKSGTTTISTATPGSTLIHATKPIIVSVRSKYDEWYSNNDISGILLPAAQSLDKEFILNYPQPVTTYVTATQTNTRILIDTGNDGSWNVNTTINPGVVNTWSSSTAAAGTRIVTDKPVIVIEIYWISDSVTISWGFELFNVTQKEFYVPAYSTTQTTYILAAEDNTTITFDSEGDGFPESNTSLNKSQTYSSTSLSYGTLVKADKPIQMVEYHENSNFAANRVTAAKELGSEHYVPYPADTIYISATLANTNLLIDKTDDGIWDTNTTINNKVAYSYTSSTIQAGSRIKTDKPVDILVRNSGPWEMSSPQPNIAVTSDIYPRTADFNSLVNVTGKIWNMIEKMYNFSVSGSIPLGFIPYPNTVLLNVSVSKYWTINDSQIGSTDYIELPLTGTGPFSYSFDHTDTDLLDEIDDEQYVLFRYKVTTPGTAGTFLFDPFSLGIGKATMWRYPWE